MSKRAALGIDVGGTKTLCLLVDKDCKTLECCKFKTAPSEGKRAFTRNLLDGVKRLNQIARADGQKVVGIGVACAGTVDRDNCRIISSPNLLCLEGIKLGKVLGKVNRNVLVENDVKAGIVAEHKLGAAKGSENVLGVFFGTGVGGAAVLNDKLYRGAWEVGGRVGASLA